MPYFTDTPGLYLLSQSFEKSGPKAIIKNEFNILNQLAAISVSGFRYSVRTYHKTIAQIMTKANP